MADAARALGVSSGAPFRHFKDRGVLMANVAAIGFDRLKARMSQAYERHPPGSLERIIAGGCAYIEFSAENPNLFKLMWGETRHDGDETVARTSGEASYLNFIDNLHETMRAEGFGDRDPREFGAPLWTMVHGYADLVVGANRMLDRDPAAISRQVSAATFAYFEGQRSS